MDTNAAVACGMGMLFMITVISIVGEFMHTRRERLLTHAERIKALEVGATLPDDPASSRLKAAMGLTTNAEEEEQESRQVSIARKGFSTGLWVAFWGFAAAAGLGSGAAVSAGVAYAIAASAGAIGVTSIICGSILALSHSPSAREAGSHNKHVADDADAYDTVSCRS